MVVAMWWSDVVSGDYVELRATVTCRRDNSCAVQRLWIDSLTRVAVVVSVDPARCRLTR